MLHTISARPLRIVPDAVHGRTLPFPIRTFADEQAAYCYFLARYGDCLKDYCATHSAEEIWRVKADILAFVHSFSTPGSSDMDAETCVAVIDALFCETCPEAAGL